jgi:hypothetical protein
MKEDLLDLVGLIVCWAAIFVLTHLFFGDFS